jgi:hypothetical protein
MGSPKQLLIDGQCESFATSSVELAWMLDAEYTEYWATYPRLVCLSGSSIELTGRLLKL